MSQIEMVLSKSETTTVYLLLILSLLRLCSGVETLRGGLDSPVGGHDGAKPPPSDHLSHFEEDVTHVERGKDTFNISELHSIPVATRSLTLSSEDNNQVAFVFQKDFFSQDFEQALFVGMFEF